MKKLVTLFVAFIACSALWGRDFEVDGIAYNILGGDSVEVTSNNYSGSVTIPTTVTNNSTTYRVVRIGDLAFHLCESLTSITIPNSVTHIEHAAFRGCSSLTTVTIPNSVTNIGDDAFSNCTSLISIIIPNSVISIENAAFSGCTSLTYVTIPYSVINMEPAFSGCTSLNSIIVDAANTHYASIDGVLFNYAKDTLIQYPIGNKRTTYTIPNSVTDIGGDSFADCTSLISITIPNSVINIEFAAFAGCTSLTSINIPNSVTNIGEGTFSGCTSIASITCYAITPPTCGEYCFEEVEKSIPLYVPKNSISAYQTADEWKDFTNILAITTAIKSVKDNGNNNDNHKVMKDGQLYILRDGKIYNAQGAFVK